MIFLKKIFDKNIFFKGIIMGFFDLIPGVSGSSIAISMGVYKKLIENLSALNKIALKAFFKGRWNHLNELLDIKFLLSLFLGILLSITLFSSILSYLLSFLLFKKLFFTFFLGIFISLIFSFIKKISKWNFYRFFFLILGSFFSFLFSFFNVNNSAGINTFSILDFSIIIIGFFSSICMLLPGFSGSLFLMVIGRYFQTISAIKSLLINGDLNALFFLIYFSLGLFLGVYVFSKILNFFLKNYFDNCFCLLIGFMIGSIKNLFFLEMNVSKINLVFVIFFISGIFLFKIPFFSKKNKDMSCI